MKFNSKTAEKMILILIIFRHVMRTSFGGFPTGFWGFQVSSNTQVFEL